MERSRERGRPPVSGWLAPTFCLHRAMTRLRGCGLFLAPAALSAALRPGGLHSPSLRAFPASLQDGLRSVDPDNRPSVQASWSSLPGPAVGRVPGAGLPLSRRLSSSLRLATLLPGGVALPCSWRGPCSPGGSQPRPWRRQWLMEPLGRLRPEPLPAPRGWQPAQPRARGGHPSPLFQEREWGKGERDGRGCHREELPGRRGLGSWSEAFCPLIHRGANDLGEVR